jgi:hypothetical protein
MVVMKNEIEDGIRIRFICHTSYIFHTWKGIMWAMRYYLVCQICYLQWWHVIFKNDEKPAARFLYFRFVVTLLLLKRDRIEHHSDYITELPTKKPFTTPRRYLRHSMLLTLIKNAGDYNGEAEEEARLLRTPGQKTFKEEEQPWD